MSGPLEDEAAPILTAAAVDRVKAIIDETAEAGLMLRIATPEDDTGPWQFSLDTTAGDGDTVLDFGVLALVLDPDARAALQGCEIDHVQGDQGEHFVVRRPGGDGSV